jgi:hypothetical protein
MGPIWILLVAGGCVAVPLTLYYALRGRGMRRTLPVVLVVAAVTLFGAFVWAISRIG